MIVLTTVPVRILRPSFMLHTITLNNSYFLGSTHASGNIRVSPVCSSRHIVRECCYTQRYYTTTFIWTASSLPRDSDKCFRECRTLCLTMATRHLFCWLSHYEPLSIWFVKVSSRSSFDIVTLTISMRWVCSYRLMWTWRYRECRNSMGTSRDTSVSIDKCTTFSVSFQKDPVLSHRLSVKGLSSKNNLQMGIPIWNTSLKECCL